MTPADITQTRTRLGLTQRQLAAYLSSLGYPVSRRTVEGWESGREPGRVYGAALRHLERRAARASATGPHPPPVACYGCRHEAELRRICATLARHARRPQRDA